MSRPRFFGWLVAAMACGWAAVRVVHHVTPVDDALPLIVVLITAVAAATHPAVQLAVPLLLAGEIAIADERLRLLWFGLVVAGAFAFALLQIAPLRDGAARSRAVVLTATAVLLLRWIPLSEVMAGREIAILALSLAIVLLLGSTPLACAAAIVTALVTTGVPLRTLLLPAVVVVVSVVARLLGLTRLRLPVTAALTVAVSMTFFAWSGAFARALPVMLRGGPPVLQRQPVRIALGPGQSAEVEIPAGANGLILSGANVPRLRPGTVVGTIDPGGIVVRIGDIADWGALRREHYHGSRNPLPERPGGLLRGYGQTAWIDASGRIAVSPGLVRVTADRRLPRQASLQIDAIELGR